MYKLQVIQITQEIKMKTTVNIIEPKDAEEIIKSGKADSINFGRKIINLLNWLIKKLLHYKKKVDLLNQYKRCF
jgi:2,4-dienoyl-CoA reductase-like NADH-dependent reductase (Old Yellow Enzyme family)